MPAAESDGPRGAPPEIPGAQRRNVTIEAHDVGPLDLHVYEAGEGPPVVMLHGWPETAWCWRHVVPLLSDRYRLICPDLRGFGWSDAPGRGYDGITFGLDAIALLDALEIDRSHVIGHDWGGFAAFAMALSHPERVDRMVVLNTMPPWIERSPRMLAQAWRGWYAVLLATAGERIARDRPDLIARSLRAGQVHDGITREDAEAYARWLSRPESARATALLYRSYLRSVPAVVMSGRFDELRLEPPTRFVFGTRDVAISAQALRGVERHGDDLTVELVDDSAHFIQEEKPELVAMRARELFGGASARA